MKTMRKQNRIFLLIVLLLVIGIGYAFVYGDLKIEGIALVKKQSWDVYFDNIQVTQGSKTPVSGATIDDNNPTQLGFNIYLENPGDFYEFTFDTVNNGTIDAMITNISITDGDNPIELPNYVTYSFKYISGRDVVKYHLLEKKSGNNPTIQTMKVRLEFRSDINPSDLEGISELNLNLKFVLTYSQATSDAINPNSLTVTLDLNGGTIQDANGWITENNTTTKQYVMNDTYGNIPTPTKSGYTFKGWLGGGTKVSDYCDELEYIESSGTQYMSIGYIPKTNTKIDVDMLFNGSFKSVDTYGGNSIFIGVADAEDRFFAANFGDLDYQSNEMYFWIDHGYFNNTTVVKKEINNNIKNNRNHLIMQSGSVQYGNVTLTAHTKLKDNLTPLYIFGSDCKSWDYNGPFTSYNMRVYGIKAYESDVLVKDYVPVINKVSHKLGLYDKVDNVFYTNIGTGEFITQYITSNTSITRNDDYTLVAIWE